METPAKESLTRLIEQLENLNSIMDPTRRFLIQKGLESTADLKREERRELLEYLKEEYRKLLH